MKFHILRNYSHWRNRLWLVFYLAVVALGGTVGAEAEKDGIVLGYNVAPGMLSQLVLRSREEIVQEVGGQKIKRIEEIKLAYAFEKKENEDDVFISRLVSIQYREATPLQVLEYDSANGVVNAPELDFYKRLEGLIAEITVTRNVLRFSCDSSSFPKDEEAHPLSLLDMDRRFYMDFQKQSFALMCRNAFINYPEGPLQVGAAWQQPVYITRRNDSVYSDTGTFFLDAIMDETIVVKYVVDGCYISLDSPVEGEITGIVVIDRASGLPLQGKISALLSGEVERLGLVVPITMDINLEFTARF